jgi:hypothetical protein
MQNRAAITQFWRSWQVSGRRSITSGFFKNPEAGN